MKPLSNKFLFKSLVVLCGYQVIFIWSHMTVKATFLTSFLLFRF